MKLIYITSKTFPSSKADPFYVKKMAEAFSKLLGENFLFLIGGKIPNEFKNINTKSIKTPRRFKTMFYFFKLPILIILRKWNSKEIMFFSYDPYLLSILIFWRKTLKFDYKIFSDWHQLFDDWKDKYVALNSDKLTCTSKRLKKFLISKCGVNSDKILTAYGGVDLNIFKEKLEQNREKLKEDLQLPKDMFLVGYAGGFRAIGQEKGLNTMIKALPHLPQNIKMVFVGGTEKDIKEYIDLARKYNVESRCIFIKKQPYEKLIEYQVAIDVLVIPYPNKHHFRDYGFPMKVWEYMASGRPIIYSNLEIIDEALGEKATSFISDNEKSLADSVLSVFNNMEEKEKIALKNREFVKSYTWDKRAENIFNFISGIEREKYKSEERYFTFPSRRANIGSISRDKPRGTFIKL